MAYGGLPVPGSVFPVPSVDSIYVVQNYQCMGYVQITMGPDTYVWSFLSCRYMQKLKAIYHSISLYYYRIIGIIVYIYIYIYISNWNPKSINDNTLKEAEWNGCMSVFVLVDQ